MKDEFISRLFLYMGSELKFEQLFRLCWNSISCREFCTRNLHFSINSSRFDIRSQLSDICNQLKLVEHSDTAMATHEDDGKKSMNQTVSITQ